MIQQLPVAVSPWELHSFNPLSPEKSLNLVLYIKPIWFLETSGSVDFALNFGCRDLCVTAELSRMIQQLAAMMLSDSDDLMVNTLLLDMVSRCYESSWMGRSRPNLVDAARRFSDYRVRKSQRLMKEFLKHHDGLDALANEVGLSRPHFFKLFKLQTGVTPNIYFNTLRSEHAIEELTQTEKSVTEIAYDLGFASQASFTRFFSMNVGIAPTNYRRVAQLT